jgi:ATP-binding cassette, subfamily B, bacterial
LTGQGPAEKESLMARSPRRDLPERANPRDLRPLVRMLPYLARYKLQIVAALASLVVASGATLIVPIAVRRILDNGFSGQNAEIVSTYFLAMLGVVAVLAVASSLRFYFVSWIGERVVADIRDDLFRHLTKLTPEFYEQQRTGEVVSRLTADSSVIKSAFSSTASIALRNAVMLVGALAMMIYTSPRMSGLATLAIPLIVIPLFIYGRRVRNLSRSAQDALAQSAAFAQERLSAITTVQSNTREAETVSQFAKATQFAFKATTRKNTARAILTALIIFVSTGAIVLLLWNGANNVISGNISPGTLGQFVLYAVFAASSLGQLAEVWGEVQSAAGAAERISELLDEKPAIASSANAMGFSKPVKGLVSFKDVEFSYPSRQQRKILNSVSFEAKPGTVTAVVGPSGAGKTTLFALLQRFHEPQFGVISIDQQDITSLDLRALRDVIATVPQDPVIFTGSIADNIRFGKPLATDSEVASAAKAARVDEFANGLPKGLDTELGERGVTLSGGQRQRVAIARAILRDAPILLLDEATSALDAESEALVQQALESLTEGRTTLVIAHRLATVRNADKIIVLDQGKVLAQGTHAQLMRKSALYSKLAKLQFTMPS